MTEEQYRERILEAEEYVNRTSLGCSRDCEGDFYWHAEYLLRYLSSLVEAEYYGEAAPAPEIPPCQCDMAERFETDAARFRGKWDR